MSNSKTYTNKELQAMDAEKLHAVESEENITVLVLEDWNIQQINEATIREIQRKQTERFER